MKFRVLISRLQSIFERILSQFCKKIFAAPSTLCITSFDKGRNHMQWIKKLGKVETSDGSIFDYEIKATISQKHGRCFKMILKPLQDILFAYLLVRVEMNKSVISKPEKLKVRK